MPAKPQMMAMPIEETKQQEQVEDNDQSLNETMYKTGIDLSVNQTFVTGNNDSFDTSQINLNQTDPNLD